MNKIPLRDLRKFMRFTQASFASMIGINRFDYIKLEKGNFNLEIRGFHLIRIQQFINNYDTYNVPGRRMPWSWYLDTEYLNKINFKTIKIDDFFPVEKEEK